MKTIIASLSLIFTVSAFAQLPDSLTCGSNAQMPEMKRFHLTEINSAKPNLNVADAPFVDDYSDEESFMLYFSNEIDNGFTVMLPMNDLEALQSGLMNSIQGTLDYKQSVDEVVMITCK
jgi:hypothetical protein